MITAQDVREIAFEKARFNGYDVGAVDDFLDEVAEALEAAQKENAVLRSKMKVLVERVDEYRKSEEALNQAVLSAQKLAVQIESEARERAANIVSDAEAKASVEIGSIAVRVKAEEQRLADAKAAAAKYIDALRTICSGELRKLDSIAAEVGYVKEEPVEEPEVEVEVEELAEEEDVKVAPAKGETFVDFDVDFAAEAAKRKAQPDATRKFLF